MSRIATFVSIGLIVLMVGIAGCPSGPQAPAGEEGATAPPADSSVDDGAANPTPPAEDTPPAESDTTGGDDSVDPPAPEPDATAEDDRDFDGIVDSADPYPDDPFNNDFDGDGVGDDVDNCFLYNPEQADSNGDGFGDVCEAALLFEAVNNSTPVVTGAVLVAYDGQYLGNINDNPFDGNSIANSFGTYGNLFSSLSIWNPFGIYGSAFNPWSPWNSFSTTPPVIIENNMAVGYVTTNAFLQPSIHPNDLALIVGRTDVLR